MVCKGRFNANTMMENHVSGRHIFKSGTRRSRLRSRKLDVSVQCGSSEYYYAETSSFHSMLPGDTVVTILPINPPSRINLYKPTHRAFPSSSTLFWK